MNPFIVGITGYKRSGKDTAAKILVENNYKRFSFADPIRRDLITLDPILDAFSGTRVTDALAVSGGDIEMLKDFPEWRRLMQVYGTEVWRAIDPSIWVTRTTDAINDDYIRYNSVGYVIPDMRFHNERDLVNFDLTVRVERPGYVNEDEHESERYIMELEVDEVLINDSTPIALQLKMMAIVGKYFNGGNYGGNRD